MAHSKTQHPIRTGIIRTGKTSSTRARILIMLAVLLSALGLGCAERNGTQMPDGIPQAAFSQSAATGAPGLMVQFTDASAGDVDSVLWDFGNGQTSTAPNPMVTFADAGSFDVSLTAFGPRGNDTHRVVAAVRVDGPPTAGFDCTPDASFAPLLAMCTSSATNASSTAWTFTNTTTGTVTNATGPSVSLSFDEPGVYDVAQTVANTIGQQASANASFEVFPISINASPGSGAPPGEILFTADVGSANSAGGIQTWIINGEIVGSGPGVFATLRTAGTYTVMYSFASSSPPLLASTTIEYVVTHGPASADFTPSVSSGGGPLDVTFQDESTGDLLAWHWDFGDGTECDFPAPAGVPASDPSVCDSASPTHTYTSIGRYDVSLEVTGAGANPGDPNLNDATTQVDAVSVTILDPSFEEQGVAMPIADAWTPLTPAGASAAAEHVALSTTETAGADAGMPTDGNQWAALDGLGTDGSEPVATIENGITQDFILPLDASVLEFDYVFLYSEPTVALVLDAMTATVSDGTTTVEIPTAQADVASPYAGSSTRYPTLGGGTTRATPLRTASLDLAAAFPGAGPDTVYTLAVRLANANNTFRSPRAYVDHVRFVPTESPITASFSAPVTIFAGEAVDFLDETCPDPAGSGCVPPTSWRWDFDTHGSIIPPASSGSGLQNPSYVFEEAGSYDVELTAQLADQVSTTQMTLDVLAAPIAIPAVVSSTGSTAPATFTFEDQSTSDPSDPIVAWSWDFAGFGVSSMQDPAPVTITQAGTWSISLTITTASGRMDTQSIDVMLD